MYCTLFSDEGSTQYIITGILGGFAMEAAYAGTRANLIEETNMFSKGDDQNAFLRS